MRNKLMVFQQLQRGNKPNAFSDKHLDNVYNICKFAVCNTRNNLTAVDTFHFNIYQNVHNLYALFESNTVRTYLGKSIRG